MLNVGRIDFLRFAAVLHQWLKNKTCTWYARYFIVSYHFIQIALNLVLDYEKRI